MITCRKCSQQLSLTDDPCPNCASITGVEAKKTFKLSFRLGVGSIVLFFASLAILDFIDWVSKDNRDVGYFFFNLISWVPAACMFAALYSVILFFVGLKTKKYKNVYRKSNK